MSTPAVAIVKLHFVVVGSGPGGLCAALSLARSGHAVTILEATETVTSLGAGLTVQPSGSKALQRLGLGDWLEEWGVQNEKIVFIRYASGEVLGTDSFGNVDRTFGAASYSVHRGHLVQKLYDLAAENENIKIRFNARVQDVYPGSDTTQPFVTLVGGETVAGDVVVGADGVKSAVRPFVTGQSDRATDTGDAAYRAIVPTSLLLKDPELATLVKDTDMSLWLAPGRHIIGYLINAKKDYNLALLHKIKDNLEESWTQKGDPDKMRALYTDFEPRVQKLLALIYSTYLWKLVDRTPISNWVHESGKVLVIGDACHPVLPYRAQGANLAIEDAEALGALFSHISSKDEIKEIALALQALRAPRCADAVEGARKNQQVALAADGQEQKARDEALKQSSDGSRDPGRIRAFLAYDARAEVDAWWEARSAKDT